MNKRSKLSGITFQAKIEELSEKITVEHSAAADSKEQHVGRRFCKCSDCTHLMSCIRNDAVL